MGLGAGAMGGDDARSLTRRDEGARRSRLVASGMILFPMISGLFFGILSAALVVPVGGFAHATGVGFLVGGVMFTVNAAALCIVQSNAWEEAPRPARRPVEIIREKRAS
jgi:hypothetical protein